MTLQPIPKRKIPINHIFTKKEYENSRLVFTNKWVVDNSFAVKLLPIFEPVKTQLLKFMVTNSDKDYDEYFPLDSNYTEWGALGVISKYDMECLFEDSIVLSDGTDYVAFPLKQFKLFYDRVEELTIYVKNTTSAVLFYKGDILLGAAMPYRPNIMEDIVNYIIKVD